MDDHNARFYDPTLGRFIQPDTIIPSFANPQSLNRYSYVENNPILLNDPTGNFGKCNEKMSGYLCKVRQNKAHGLEQQWSQEAAQKKAQMIALQMAKQAQMDSYADAMLGHLGGGMPSTNIPQPAASAGTPFMTPQTSDYSHLGAISPYSIRYPSSIPYETQDPITALVLGFSGGGGAGVFNVGGAEDVFMNQDGKIAVQAFGYAGQGQGIGGDVAPYFGVVANLKDFASYRGPFSNYSVVTSLVTLSYFHDVNADPLQRGAVQGLSASAGGFGFSASQSTTYFEMFP